MARRILFSIVALFAIGIGCAGTARAASGTWTNTSGGSWATGSNWSGSTIADGQSSTANFGTLTLSAAPSVLLDGARTIGNLTFGDVGNAYGWTVNTGSGGPLTLDVSSGIPTLTVNNQTTTVGLILAGTKGLTKAGSGTLVLSGANTYTGGTTVTAGAGVVTVQNNQSAANGGWSIGPTATTAATTVNFDTGSTIAVASGNQIRIGNNAATGNNTQTLNVSGAVNNSGTLYVGRPGVLTLLNGANWTQGSDMSINAQGGYSSSMSITTGVSFAYTGFNLIAINPASGSTGNATLTLGGGTFTTSRGFTNAVASSTGSGSIVMTNGATIAMSAGIPQLLGTAGSTLNFRLGNGGGVIDTAGYSCAITGIISNVSGQTGALTKSGTGTLTLGAANAFSGDTKVSGGALLLDDSNALGGSTLDYGSYGGSVSFGTLTSATFGGLKGSQNLALLNAGSSAVALTVGGNNQVLTYSGILSGTAGSLTKAGTGTLTIGRNSGNTLTGPVTVNAGYLLLGTLTGTGTVTFNTPSLLTVQNGAVLDLPMLHGTTVQTATWTLSPITLESGGSIRFRASTGSDTHNLAAAISSSGTTTLNNNGGAYASDINLSGLLSGSGTISYIASSGSGSSTTTRTLTLSNTGTTYSGNWFVDYTGSTSDDFVALKSTATGALGSGTVTLDDRARLISGATDSLGSLSGATLQKATSYVDVNSSTALQALNGTAGTVSGTATTLSVGSGSFSGTLSGTMGLTKTGSGTLTLGAANAHTGSTWISGGTLALGASGSIATTPSITLASGTTFDVSAVSGYTMAAGQSLIGSGVVTGNTTTASSALLVPGGDLTAGTLSFASHLTLNSTSTNLFDFTSSGNDTISVASNLTANTSVVYLNPMAPLSNGTYRLFNYGGSLGGSFNATVGKANPTRKTLTIDTATANQVNLVVSGNASSNLVWQPTVSGGNWNTPDQNWSDGSASTFYYDGDNVTFNASGAGTNTINITGTVYPGAITVSGASNYTFSATGQIGGQTALSKSGTGTLTIAGSNSFSGGTTLSGGRIQMQSVSSLGTGAITLNGGTLGVALQQTVANDVAIGAGGGTLDGEPVATPYVTFSGILSGSGPLSVVNTVALSNPANTYSGAVTIATGSSYLKTTADEVLGDSTTINLNGSGANFTILGGKTETIDALNGTGGSVFCNGAGATTLGVGAANGTGSYAGTIDNSAGVMSVVKLGTGTQTLAGLNTFSGSVAVSNGTLRSLKGNLGAATALGQNNTVTVASGATLDVGGSNSSGNIGASQSNTLTINGGTLNFSASGGNMYDGPYLGVINLSGANVTSTTGSGPRWGYTQSSGTVNVTGADSTWSAPIWMVSGAGKTLTFNTVANLALSGNITDFTGLGGLPLVKTGTGTLTLSGVNTYTGPTTVSTGTLTIGGAGQLGGGTYNAFITNNAALSYVSSAAQTFGNVISGSGSLYKGGGSVLTLTGTNTFTGNLTIDGGQVTISGTAAGSGVSKIVCPWVYVNAGGTLYLGSGSQLSWASGTPSIRLDGGTLGMSDGQYNYIKNIVMTNGALWALGTGSSVNGLTGANFNLTNVTSQASGYTNAITSRGGAIAASSGIAFTVDRGSSSLDLIVGGILADYNGTLGRITKNGAGILALTTNNTYSGGTLINAGTIQIGTNGTAGTIGTGAVTNNGSLLFYRSDNLTAGNYITGAGSLTKSGAGTLTLTNANDYAGGTLLNTGVLQAGHNTALGTGALTYGGVATLHLTSATGATIANDIVLAAAVRNTLLVTGGSLTHTLTGNIGGGGVSTELFLNTGSADGLTTFLLSGNNSFTGQTTLNRGRILAGSPTAFGLASNVVKLDSYQNATDGSLEFASSLAITNPITLSYATVYLKAGAGVTGTLAGVVSGSQALGKVGAGTLTLSGTNTYTVGTVVAGGVLETWSVSDSGPSGIGTGYLSLKNGVFRHTGMGAETTARLLWIDQGAGTFDIVNGTGSITFTATGGNITYPLTKNGAGSLRIDDVLQGAATVTVNAGALTLNGVSTYAGATTVNGGRLWGTGSIANSAVSMASGTTLGPTNSAVLGTFGMSNLSLADGARVSCLVNGSTPTINVLGNLTTAGTNWVDLVLASPLTAGTYTLIDYTTLSGTGVFQLSRSFGRQSVTLSTNVSASAIELVVSAPVNTNLVWQGDASGAWDVDATTNWLTTPGGAQYTFAAGDTVTFDDTATSTTVTVAEVVGPALTTVNNATKNFVISGSAISGSGGLNKTGAGTLTLNSGNTYTGVTVISNGVLVVSSLANGGSASPIGAATSGAANLVLNGGALRYTGGSTTIDRMFTVNSAGGVLDVTNAASTLTVNGAGWALNGTLTKRGAGTLALTNYRLSGSSAALDCVVEEGTLSFGTQYDWTSSLPTDNNMDILVTNGATLSMAPSAFAGVPNTTGGSLHQVTVTENSTWVITGNSRSFIQGGTPVILQGGRTYDSGGSYFMPLYDMGIQSLASTVISTNGIDVRPYNSNRTCTFSVADGSADPDLVMDATLNGNVGYLTKNGTGTLKLAVDSGSFSGKTTVNAGLVSLDAESRLGANPGAFAADQLTLNGGGLQATATFTLDDANRGVTLGASGGSFAPDAGVNMTLATTIAGAGALTHSGAGTTTLSATNAYTGATTISTGTLKLAVTGSISNSPTLTLASGAWLDVTAAGLGMSAGQQLQGTGAVTGNVVGAASAKVVPGALASVGTLTIGGNYSPDALTTNYFDLNTDTGVGGGTNDLLAVGGDLNLNGSCFVINDLTSLSGNTNYVLIAYTGTRSGTGTLVTTGTGRKTYALSYNDGNKQVLLSVTGTSLPLVWNPQDSTNWDQTASNWTNSPTGPQGAYYDGDAVSFTDLGAVSNNVALAGTNLPGSVLVNTESNYVFSGSGKISGNAGLTKAGSGTLTIATTNDYQGITTISNGMIRIAADSALGTAPASAVTNQLTLNGGALAVTVTGQTLAATRGIAIGAAGGTLDTSALGATGTTTIGPIISGSGPLTLAASGNQSPSGGGDSGLGIKLNRNANAFAGNVTITAGLVSYAANGSFGNATNQIVLNGGGLLDNNVNVPLSRNIQVLAGSGTFRAYGSTAVTWSGAISGSGTIRRTDGGTLTLSGDLSAYSGIYSNQGGTTIKSGATAMGGTLTVTNGTFSIENSVANTYAAVNFGGSAGVLRVKSNNSALGSATVTVSGNATLGTQSGSSAVTLSNNITFPGTQTLSLDSYYANMTLSGSITGSGATLQTTSSGTTTLGGTVSLGTGTLAVPGGQTLTIASGAAVTADNVGMGGTTAANILNITGGTITGKFFNIGNGSGGSGRITQSGGTVFAVSGGNGIRIGHWNNNANPSSSYTLAGGTLDATALSANSGGSRMINVGWDGLGVMTVGGGASTATVKAYGIQLDANGDSGSYSDTLTVSTNGFVEIGAGSIGGASTSDKVILDGGTLKATAAATWSAAMTANLATTSTLDTAGFAVTASGAMDGAGGLAKAGAQTLTLSTAKTYTGDTLVTGGTLLVNDGNTGDRAASALGSTALYVGPGARLLLGNTCQLGWSNNATNTINGGTLSTANSIHNYLKHLVLTNGATVSLGTGGYSGTWQSFGFNDVISKASPSANTISGGTVEMGAGIFQVEDGTAAPDLTVGTVLSNRTPANGSLLKTGTGVLTLSSANGYAGGSTIRSGAVWIQNADGLGTGVATLGDAGTGTNDVALYLDTNRSTDSRGVVVSSLAGGILTLGSRSTVGSSGNNNGFTTITLQRNVIFDSNAADRTDYRSISGTGNIRITGTGRTIFNTVSTFAGNITLANTGAGYFQIGTATAGNQNYIPDTCSMTIESGTFSVSVAGESIDGLNGGGLVNVNSINGTLTVGANNSSGTFAGTLANSGSTLAITKAGTGTQVLTGTNTYSAATTITGGTLQIGDGGGTGTLGTGSVVDNATLTFNRTNLYTVSNAISGSGGVVQMGSGELVIATAASWGGPTAVSGGNLRMNAVHTTTGNYSVASNATISGSGTITGGTVTVQSGGKVDAGATSGAVGTLFVSGLSLQSGSALHVDISGTTADLVSASGAVTLGGTVEVNDLGASDVGGDWLILQAANPVTGTITAPAGYLIRMENGNRNVVLHRYAQQTMMFFK